jgi:hypothetical protein
MPTRPADQRPKQRPRPTDVRSTNPQGCALAKDSWQEGQTLASVVNRRLMMSCGHRDASEWLQYTSLNFVFSNFPGEIRSHLRQSYPLVGRDAALIRRINRPCTWETARQPGPRRRPGWCAAWCCEFGRPRLRPETRPTADPGMVEVYAPCAQDQHWGAATVDGIFDATPRPTWRVEGHGPTSIMQCRRRSAIGGCQSPWNMALSRRTEAFIAEMYPTRDWPNLEVRPVW